MTNQETTKDKLKEVISALEMLLWVSRLYGDFRNGNVHEGIDEGQGLADNFFNEIERELEVWRE